MDRLKTFRNYCLYIIVFFIFSNIATNVMISNSYANLSQETNVIKSDEGITVEPVDVKANRRQGIFKGKVINTSNEKIDKKYIHFTQFFINDLLYINVRGITKGKFKGVHNGKSININA